MHVKLGISTHVCICKYTCYLKKENYVFSVLMFSWMKTFYQKLVTLQQLEQGLMV